VHVAESGVRIVKKVWLNISAVNKLESDINTFYGFRNLHKVKSKRKTRKNAIVEYLDYQIPVTQLKGQKENGDMQAVKRD